LKQGVTASWRVGHPISRAALIGCIGRCVGYQGVVKLTADGGVTR